MPASTEARTPPAGEAVADRLFALLNSFDASHRSQTLASIAGRTGLPHTSALRLARQLTGVGALERLDDGRYVVGPHLLEIASLAPRRHRLRSVAMPFLEDLFDVTGQHVLLAVRDGGEALLLERLCAHDTRPVRFRVGGRMPLSTTGVGLVLLAFAPAKVQERALDDFAPDAAHARMHTPEDLRRTLNEIRRGDYAVATRARPWPRTTAGAPVREGQRVVAAVSVVAPSTDFDMSAYAPAIRTTARAISRQMTSLGTGI